MKIKVKKVYYCDFCKKHSLRNLTEHEKHCTANPNRICKLCELCGISNDIPKLIEKYKEIAEPYNMMNSKVSGEVIDIPQDDILKLLKEDTDYCPNCILTILRCSGLNILVHMAYDYKEEMKNFWEEFNKDNRPNY